LEVYAGKLARRGAGHESSIITAVAILGHLLTAKRFGEVKSFAREQIPLSTRAMGAENRTTLLIRWRLAIALYQDPDASLDDIVEAATTLEDVSRRWIRVFGPADPDSNHIQFHLQNARKLLAWTRANKNES
jgi:hypothetical protein